MPVNPNEAPEGFEAAFTPFVASCGGCVFESKCMPWERKLSCSRRRTIGASRQKQQILKGCAGFVLRRQHLSNVKPATGLRAACAAASRSAVACFSDPTSGD